MGRRPWTCWLKARKMRPTTTTTTIRRKKEDVLPVAKDRQVYRQLSISFYKSSNRLPEKAAAAVDLTLPRNCCSCINPSCQPTGRRCLACSGLIGSRSLLFCSSCEAVGCTNCDAVGQCVGSCGISYCTDCATSRDGGVICSICIS